MCVCVCVRVCACVCIYIYIYTHTPPPRLEYVQSSELPIAIYSAIVSITLISITITTISTIISQDRLYTPPPPRGGWCMEDCLSQS